MLAKCARAVPSPAGTLVSSRKLIKDLGFKLVLGSDQKGAREDSVWACWRIGECCRRAVPGLLGLKQGKPEFAHPFKAEQ